MDPHSRHTTVHALFLALTIEQHSHLPGAPEHTQPARHLSVTFTSPSTEEAFDPQELLRTQRSPGHCAMPPGMVLENPSQHDPVGSGQGTGVGRGRSCLPFTWLPAPRSFWSQISCPTTHGTCLERLDTLPGQGVLRTPELPPC